MPRVPEYNQRQIELSPANTPYQDMKPTAEQFGSYLGQAMQNLGKSLGSVAGTLGDTATYLHKVEQEKNETAAVDLFNQYTAAQSKIADSYQTLSGKLAVDGYTATEKQLSILKRDYLSRAANPAQAELLSKAMEAGSATALGQMQRYRDQQQGVYEDDVSDTRVGLMLGNVRRFYNDDRESAKSVYLAQVESLDQLRRHNAGTEEIKAKLAQVASTGMRQRIEGAMEQHDLGMARRLFDGHADSLLAPDREAMAAQLGHLEFNDRVENETTRILQASPLRLGSEQHGKTATEPSPPDAEGRLVMVEKIADPELRQRVRDRIDSQNIRDRQTYLNQQRQLKGQAKDIIDQGGSFTDIPYQMLIGIDAKGKSALSAYAKAGGKVTTDPVAYYGLKNLALDDLHAFLDVDLHDHLGEIEATDLATLDQLQQSLRSGKHDPQHNLERIYKDNIDRSLRGADLSATDEAHIYRQIDRNLAGHQAATGRKATPAEQQKMADQAVIDMKLDQRSNTGNRAVGVMPSNELSNGVRTENNDSGTFRMASGELRSGDGKSGAEEISDVANRDDSMNPGNANHGRRGFFDHEPDGAPNHRPRANKAEAQKDDGGPGNANHSSRAALEHREGGSPNHRAKATKNVAKANGIVELPTFTFELNGEEMSALQDPNGKSFPAFSGLLGAINDPSKTALEKIGPLPQGTYYIVNREPGGRRYRIRQWFEELGLSDIGGWLTRADKDEWFALYRADDSIDDLTTVDGVERGQFRLHHGRFSEGCITVHREKDYAKIREKLLNSEPRLIPGTKILYYGTIQVR